MKSFIYFCELWAFLIAPLAYAQSQTPLAEHSFLLCVSGGMALNIHLAEFSQFPSQPLVTPPLKLPSFGTVKNLSPYYSLFAEYLASEHISFSLRASFEDNGAVFETRERTLIGTATGQFSEATIVYFISANYSTFNIEPMISVQVIDHLRFYAGCRLNFALQKTFSQAETIEIDDASLQGGFDPKGSQRQRNLQTGTIPSVPNVLGGLIAGVGYEIPLGQRGVFILTPEIFYTYIFNHISSEAAWKLNTLRSGLALKILL